MGRQERAARRAALAERQATDIIDQATTRVQRRAPQKAAVPTQRAAADAGTTNGGAVGTVDLAAECRRLRDTQGMAWWLIGKTLGLEGAGDSAATGKGGAHRARTLYRSTGAEVPRTRAPRNGTRAPRGPGQVGSKTERKIALTEGNHVIPEDYTDDQVLALVAGRTIEWGVNLNDLDGKGDQWFNQEARVHPTTLAIEDGKRGRVLVFRHFYGYDDGRPISGATSSVYVHAIHTVR